MALFMLAAAFGVIAQLLVIAAQQQRGHERRRLATQEAANLLERVMARPWNALTAEQVDSLDLPAAAKTRLPDARVRIGIVNEEGEPARKQVRIRVDWLNRAGQREQPVQLVAWKHRLERSPAP
ncbi:MAG: hypothetical protein ACC628_23675 [Pirellulaceae bacterium]